MPKGMRKAVERPGGEFAFVGAGDQEMPLVICLHGFPDHPVTFAGLMGTLAEAGFRSVAPWMRGYTPSTLDGPFDIERLADDALELADKLSPDRPVAFLGHGFGALAAFGAAARRPERASHVVSLGVPHPLAFMRGLLRPSQLIGGAFAGHLALPWLGARTLWKGDFEYVDTLWRKWSPGYVLAGHHRSRLKSCLAASMPAPLGYHRSLMSPRTFRGLRKLFAEAIAPATLHVHGRRDGCVPERLADGQESLFRGRFDHVVIDDAGHFVHLEAPAKVVSLVLNWLRER
jgi:pimeloyl-ACP methyl ester carboxylesterase